MAATYEQTDRGSNAERQERYGTYAAMKAGAGNDSGEGNVAPQAGRETPETGSDAAADREASRG